jgi:hypothetical protein
MFKHFTMKLVAELKSAKVAVNVFDGSKTSIEPLGVNYVLISKLRGARGANDWFPGTLAGQRAHLFAMRAKHPLPDYSNTDVGLFFHWPTFLGGAALGGSSALRPFALELLGYVQPLVKQFDPMFAADLEHVNRALAKGDWPHQLDELRFDAHLRGLTANRSFMRHFTQTMDSSWSKFRQTHLETQVTGCPVKKHRKGQNCEVCEGSYWTREYATMLMIRRYDVPELRADVKLELDSPSWFSESPEPWINEVLHWQGGCASDDGVVPLSFAKSYGHQTLVNFQLLLEAAKRTGRDSPLLRFLDPGLSSDTWGAGYKAKVAFDLWSGGKYAAERHPVPLSETVQIQGWEWRDILEHPYGVYLTTALQSTLARSADARQKLGRRQTAAHRHDAKPRTRRTVNLSYGETPIQAIRRTLRYAGAESPVLNYFSPPADVDVSVFRAEERRRCVVTVGNAVFLSVQGYNRITNLVDRNNEPLYPWANVFKEWLLVQDAALTDERFRQLEYEAGYSVRVAKKLRGEARHIGQFTEFEVTLIRNYFSTRSRGRVTKMEWENMLMQLPTRSEAAIRLQVEKLGKEYAWVHGYAKYASSGFCLSRSAKRRTAWLKEGIQP